jgi:transglutaminase-like putative cysteine protease
VDLDRRCIVATTEAEDPHPTGGDRAKLDPVVLRPRDGVVGEEEGEAVPEVGGCGAENGSGHRDPRVRDVPPEEEARKPAKAASERLVPAAVVDRGFGDANRRVAANLERTAPPLDGVRRLGREQTLQLPPADERQRPEADPACDEEPRVGAKRAAAALGEDVGDEDRGEAPREEGRRIREEGRGDPSPAPRSSRFSPGGGERGNVFEADRWDEGGVHFARVSRNHAATARGAALAHAIANMRFDVASQLEYVVRAPSTIIFNVHALRTASQTVLEEALTIEPYIKHEEYISSTGESRFVRLETGKIDKLDVSYHARVDVEHSLVAIDALDGVPMHKLAHDIVPFLFPSRYCQSDMLGRLAYRHFGKIDDPYARVVAITEWVHDNVEYVAGTTNAQTSAYDTVTQGTGVCRDFAHLAIALCRAMNIPARYFTGYAFKLDPPDFHACFEAFLGGRWMLFDPTRLAPLNGIVRIASGRDAADTSVATIFGQVSLARMKVSCVLSPEAAQDFAPITHAVLGKNGVSLERAG